MTEYPSATIHALYEIGRRVANEQKQYDHGSFPLPVAEVKRIIEETLEEAGLVIVEGDNP